MVGPGGLTSGCAVKPLVWKSPRNQARVMAPSKSPEKSPRVKEARMLGSPHPKQCEGHDNPHQLEWIPVLMRPSTFGTQSMQLELEQHTFHATVRLTHKQFGSFSVLQFPKVTLSFTYLHAYTTLIPHVKPHFSLCYWPVPVGVETCQHDAQTVLHMISMRNDYPS